jgi:phosphoribosylformimino-5-aminoimidazole carboxamide ribotide isomerase
VIGHPDLYPAIDVRAGRVVRLAQGDYRRETVYGDDPAAVAERFASDGATWIHVVDLDAARHGDPVNRPVVARIVAAVAGRARVQTGGGVRSVADAEALARLGVARVVMGSAAVNHPELVEEVAELVAVGVGLDHRAGRLAVHGWTEDSGLTLDEALDAYPSASVFVVTDIERDGGLGGPDVAGLAACAARTSIPVIASGGVADLDDVRALAAVDGIAGVIAGRAIYEGRFTVAEALAVLGGNDR